MLTPDANGIAVIHPSIREKTMTSRCVTNAETPGTPPRLGGRERRPPAWEREKCL